MLLLYSNKEAFYKHGLINHLPNVLIVKLVFFSRCYVILKNKLSLFSSCFNTLSLSLNLLWEGQRGILTLAFKVIMF